MRFRLLVLLAVMLPSAGLWVSWRAYRSQDRWRLALLALVLLAAGAYPLYLVLETAYWAASEFTRLSVVVIVAGAAGVLCIYALWRGVRFRALAGLAALGFFALAVGVFWYTHRPLPEALYGQALFQGVTYTREVRREPRPMVVHVVVVDLTTPGLRLLVTPGVRVPAGDNTGMMELRARTTSEFLAEFGLQVAINGGYFRPWHNHSPLNYYPRSGDPVNALGFASSEGVVYSPEKREGEPVVYFSADNRVSINTPVGAVYNALNANFFLLREGRETQRAWLYEPQSVPRTALGVDASGDRLILLVVDGRQPNYSEGARMQDLIAILRQYGAYNAVRLDGGGSSTLVMAGSDGLPVVLNSPIHGQIPGMERPVANHLGIYAPPLEAASSER